MPITVRGSLHIGEIKPPRTVDIKKHIQEKLNMPNTVIEVKPEPQTKVESVNNSHKNMLRRQIPVKVTNLADDDYRYVEEAELIKHYNKKSSYLNDMIESEEIK